MAEVSVMVANRMVIAGTVKASVQVHGGPVAGALEQVLFPDGRPPDGLAAAPFIAALGAALARSEAALRGADEALGAERADDPARREARDAAASTVRAQLMRLAALLEGLYGPEVVRAYGLAGETPEGLQEQLQAADTVVGRLRGTPITAPPLVAGMVLDAEAVAAELARHAEVLRTELAAVARESREEQLALGVRDEALRHHDSTYQGVATALEGLYRLAGRADLADLVRPTARRRQGLPEPADTAPTPAPAPPEVPAPPA